MSSPKQEVTKRLPTASLGDLDILEIHIPAIPERCSEELVLAVVGRVGSGCSRVIQILKELLEHDFGYVASIHKLSDVITGGLSL